MLRLATVAMVKSIGLAACGGTRLERCASGAGIGAAAGAAASGVTGGNILGGALLGGAAGDAAGALTDQDDIDLGDRPDPGRNNDNDCPFKQRRRRRAAGAFILALASRLEVDLPIHRSMVRAR